MLNELVTSQITNNNETLDSTIKIMFVDDETKIRKLLQICINWEALGYKIVAEVGSAVQALEVIPTTKPDVIITDIQMPFIDGLQFAKMVKQEHPNIAVIMLTAHNHFDYAREGVSIGVSGFLLKPINREELTKTVTEIRSQIIHERNTLYEYAQLKKRLDDNWNILVKNFLNELVFTSLPSQKIEEKLQYYKIPLNYHSGYFALLSLSFDATSDEETNIFHHIQCQELITSVIKHIPGVIQFEDAYQNIIILSDNKNINLYNCLSHVSTLIYDHLNINLYSGIGEPVPRMKDISTMYKQACSSMKIAKLSKNEVFVSAKSVDSEFAAVLALTNKILEEVTLCIKVPLPQESIHLIDKIYKLLEKKDMFSYTHITVISVLIINVVLSIATEMGIIHDQLYKEDESPYKTILEITTLENNRTFVLSMANKVIKEIGAYNQGTRDKLISQISLYVKENLGDSGLSLKKISELNYVNPSYLSRIFKEVSGTTFMDYLVHARIDKAKKLLENTNLKIYEIAEIVGIADPNYFSKYFKKYTNYTPAQYKEEFSSTSSK